MWGMGWGGGLDSDASGNEFYYNAMTGVSTYEHPLDEHYRAYYRRIKVRTKWFKRNELERIITSWAVEYPHGLKPQC
jgi:hypothetical protein